MDQKIIINKMEDWDNVVKVIIPKIKPLTIFLLEGELGVGKTTFMQILGKKLMVKEKIVSPTFNIVNSYNSKKGQINHIDAYRLKGASDIESFDEYIYHDGITFVEWPEILNIKNPTALIKIKIINTKREVIIKWF